MPAVQCRVREIDDVERKNLTVTRCARALIARHPHFQSRPAKFEFEYRQNVLTIRGSVPTFHLKQLLQSALMRLDDVDRIDNRVDVVRQA